VTVPVDIPGYGQVLVRSLCRGEMELIAYEADGVELLQLAEIVRRGCVRPDVFRISDAALAAEFDACPDALEAIGAAILERSWPAVDV
jgi:hypothetical protein